MQIKFDNNSIVSIPYTLDSRSDYAIGGTTTIFSQVFIVDDEMINIFHKGKIIFIRFNHTKGKADFEIDKKKGDLIINTLKLFGR